jgi:hypothetical protein
MPLMENAHGLVIGIADYEHFDKLPRVKDAEGIAAVLTDAERCGYPRENVRVLLESKATLAAVREGLGELVRCAGPDSSVFLYFSGHGGRIESGPHTGQYLLPVDAIYATEQRLAETALPGDELTAALRKLAARKVVVVLDCCHAAGMAQPRELGPTLKPGLSEGYYEALKVGGGRVIFASSRPDECSYVLPGADYGLFTQHLLDGLCGGAVSEDGYVRVFDLFEYLHPKVSTAHPRQHPIFRAEVEENFPIALYRGRHIGVVPKDKDGFRYDAYVSYVDGGRDSVWVWDTLVPRLEQACLRVAVSGDVERRGVARVINIERGIKQSRRTLVVLSEAYLASTVATFENVLAQTLDLLQGTWRVIPVKIAPIEDARLPTRLSMLSQVDLSHPRRADREFDILIDNLKEPLPRCSG